MWQQNHWRFFLITFAWSWGFWLVPVALGFEPFVSKVFYALGGIAPTCTGIILAYQKLDSGYWRDFWQRILSFRQIGSGWHLFMLGFFPLVALISLAIYYLTSGALPELTTLLAFLANPIQLIPFAIFTLFFGPIPEEIGWRGYALDHLEKRYSWVTSSVILGSFWAMWHLPQFFITGTYQHGLLQESLFYALGFLGAFFPLSVIMDWIYHNTGKSILSGVLFHFYTNFFGEVIDLPNQIKHVISLSILWVIALLLLVIWWKGPAYRQSTVV